MGLLIIRPPEQRRVEFPEAGRSVAGGQHEIGYERGDGDGAEQPGGDDVAQLALPEIPASVLRKRHEAEIAGKEEHHGHDENVGPADKGRGGKKGLGLVHHVPPFRGVGHVAHGGMEDDHEPDDGPSEIVEGMDARSVHIGLLTRMVNDITP